MNTDLSLKKSDLDTGFTGRKTGKLTFIKEKHFICIAAFIAASLAACLSIMSGCANHSRFPIASKLSGWSYYLEDPEAKQEDTWWIEDGILVCSGTPRGYLYTDDSFRDFTMTLKWRWPDEESAGKGGILIDAVSEHKIWPKSLEAQINANDAGDFWALDGYKVIGAISRTEKLTHEEYGELIHINKIAPAENLPGKWNTYKIIAKGTTVILIINDQLVNRATRVNASGGKICITSEGTPIEFKDIKIVPE